MATDYQIRPITAEEYHRMGALGLIGADERVELLDGALIAMPPIGEEYVFAVNQLAAVFNRILGSRAVVHAQSPLGLDANSEPEPDVMLLIGRPERYRNYRPKPSDVSLVVEVAETSLRYDRGRKLDAYARAGIAEVWIVNVPARCVERYDERSDARYARTTIFEADATIVAAAFPADPIAIAEFMP